jgi:glycosyltransferase involved in cell wall biosynthesis
VVSIPHSGSAAARNRGAEWAIHPYLFFCDADVRLERRCFRTLCSAMEKSKEASWAYCDFVFNGIEIKSREFSYAHLKSDNYISTMSLIYSDQFPGFDEDLGRFQDWSLWLKMARDGKSGVYVPETLFCAETGGVSGADGLHWRKVVQDRYVHD